MGKFIKRHRGQAREPPKKYCDRSWQSYFNEINKSGDQRSPKKRGNTEKP